ncbi:hypothetical protein RHMOL_Rhmol12G0048300 [Rhododendron molle]|uniref:Uncharacterized protein n=1 Tax=Rhododendron molle TaxID=49168 RepID=A0ACC0LEH6_RHOML|nr:hypothetical protein RHMOL_Rhmol12G0048300 [Rhododendron molle]
MEAKIGKFFESVGNFLTGGDHIPWSDGDIVVIGSPVFKFWNLMFLTSAADKLDAEAFDEWIRELDVGSDGTIRYEELIARMISGMMRQIAVTVATLLLVALEIPTGLTLPSTVPAFLWSPLEDGLKALMLVSFSFSVQGRKLNNIL